MKKFKEIINIVYLFFYERTEMVDRIKMQRSLIDCYKKRDKIKQQVIDDLCKEGRRLKSELQELKSEEKVYHERISLQLEHLLKSRESGDSWRKKYNELRKDRSEIPNSSNNTEIRVGDMVKFKKHIEKAIFIKEHTMAGRVKRVERFGNDTTKAIFWGKDNVSFDYRLEKID